MSTVQTGKRAGGFTLIELIAVIVVLGVLGAVALPRFINLSAAAEEAALQRLAAVISSVSAQNYAMYIAERAGLPDAPGFVDVVRCADVTRLLEGDVLPQGYQLKQPERFVDQPAVSGSVNPEACTLVGPAGGERSFAVYGVEAF